MELATHPKVGTETLALNVDHKSLRLVRFGSLDPPEGWVATLLKIEGIKPGTLSIPRWLAWNMAGLIEIVWKITQRQDTPPITRTIVRLIGQELTFSDQKACNELSYTPIMSRSAGLEDLVKSR